MSDRAASAASENVGPWREQFYNATVLRVEPCHPDLMKLRVAPDLGLSEFKPGQYLALGLGAWEPFVDGIQPQPTRNLQEPKLIKRAYSIACSVLDDQGELKKPGDFPYLEFYVTLVRRGLKGPPELSPRLFMLPSGGRLFCGQRAKGSYTLDAVKPSDNVVLIATGTGEAPHTSMIAELLSRNHPGRIVSLVGTRYRKDLGYVTLNHELERRYANFRYLALTTREPENVDPAQAGYIGKRYLQEIVDSGDFERATGVVLDPETTHVFLCGNPAMIGATALGPAGAVGNAAPSGMTRVLEERGFQRDRPGQWGNLHFEQYW